MRTKWNQPQGMRLAERLKEVASGLREAAPLLVEAQVRAFEGMAATARLASQPRRLSSSPPDDRRDTHE